MMAFQPKVMGILNVTPDSFSDGGKFFTPEAAVAQANKLIAEGADILDIGGESTRPGAEPVDEHAELERVIPVIEAVRTTSGIPISIDTRRAVVMKAALQAGATMINDVTALSDPESAQVVAEAEVPVCLMHMQGEPGTMQNNPTYADVVADVSAFLGERIAVAEAAGISRDNIYADVGIGFGKTLEHNCTLLKELNRFHDLGVPLMLGASRKRFIAALHENGEQTTDRIGGSLAAVQAGRQARVAIFRVHDVLATKQFLTVMDALQ